MVWVVDASWAWAFPARVSGVMVRVVASIAVVRCFVVLVMVFFLLDVFVSILFVRGRFLGIMLGIF